MLAIANIHGVLQWMHGLVLLGDSLLSHLRVKICFRRWGGSLNVGSSFGVRAVRAFPYTAIDTKERRVFRSPLSCAIVCGHSS